MGLTSQSEEQVHTSSKITRRTHRKSRTGCFRCKRRRIKCDETKPECHKCVAFGVECDYEGTATKQQTLSLERSIFRNSKGPPKPSKRSVSSIIRVDETQSSSSVKEQLHSSDIVQQCVQHSEEHIENLRLLNHFITRKHDSPHSIKEPGARDPLYDQALLLTFTYPCILHLIYEFSALELAHQQPLRREYYRSLAERHSDSGLRGATDLLRQMDSKDCHAIYTAATFACINYFARGPQHGEYLLFGERGLPHWLPLLHGLRTIIDLVGIEKIAAGPLENKPFESAPKANEPAAATFKYPPLDWTDHFERLQAFVAAPSCPDSAVDAEALARLAWCYEATYGREDGGFQGDANHQNVFVWPYQLGDDFKMRMQERKPVPLIIAAHFALLLQNYEFIWFMEGWSDHIMTGICRFIDDDYRGWLEWPVEQANRLREAKEMAESNIDQSTSAV